MTQITPEQIAEWKVLAVRATVGPYVIFQDGKFLALAPAGRFGDICTFGKDAVNAENNLAFIRSAFTAVPALIAAHEAAQARIAEIKNATENLIIGIGMGWDLDGLVEAVRATLANRKGVE